ncbi:putative mediator of RNA polymerase II transcription subunit 5 [Cercophora samala]|uniref:Mediator of RNA polymerase II transcription subunit 5 n=1 Tax=Cercophora samala TaxID=330535 RepID=A0AA40DEK7_9PEZI|nr:putative mediator of RNA polymerase II transcription subunit 5 [Cercophora samala]
MEGPATAASSLTGLPAAVAQWEHLITRARLQRLDPDQFAVFSQILFVKHPLPPALISELLLRPTADNNVALDPRAPLYLTHLIKQRRVDTASVLKALFKYSTIHTKIHPQPEDQPSKEREASSPPPPPPRKKLLRWTSSYSSEAILFWRLAQTVNQGIGIKSGRDVVETSKILVRWMALFTEAATIFSQDAFGSMHSLNAKLEMERSRESFIMFLNAFSANPTVPKTFLLPAAKGLRKQLAQSLEAFLPSIMQVNPSIASQLEMFRAQSLVTYDSIEKKDAAVSDMNSYMDNVMGLESFQVPEIPIVNTRAGLYIYLSAALVGRPMIDDVALFTYLHNRYRGDVQQAAVHLILASFDVLANAVFRNEGAKAGHLLKSFVVNKVPLVLVSLAQSSPLYPFNPEICITEALGQVDTNIFPTFSGLFDMSSNTGSSFQDSVRQDFCFACQLHGLLSQPAIQNLLGDITYQTLPDEGRYVKDILVQSCLQDSDKTQKLIGELDNMNGNVGAAAQAVVEVIGSLCRNTETMALKQLCSQLASKPLSLDILLLFSPAQKILHPLRELIDHWGGYDEEQGEYQPVYEEFGSILLLLMAFVYRYNLSPADLGVRSPDSFVGKLIGGGHTVRLLSDLSPQEHSHLNGWIQGLFAEGGLGDELMASCPPQDFYLLMPVLFGQISVALSSGYLNEETLKSGLEYLVEVFLLPSLVPAILYLSNQLWAEGPEGQRSIIKILQLLIRPNSISNEASAMFQSVLNIVAKPLEHALRSYQRSDPKSQEVEPLLRAIKENLTVSRRTGGADHAELESWTTTHGNHTPGNHGNGSTLPGSLAGTNRQQAQNLDWGILAAVRHTIQNLVNSVQQAPLGGNTTPTAYTHRQTLAALKLLGAKQLLTALLDELKTLTESGQGSAAYDVVCSLVCAPDVTNDTSLASTNPANDDGTGAGGFAAAAPPPPPPPPPPVQRRLTLREVLKHEAEEWKKMQKGDPVMAETVVRLYRQVEGQMEMPQTAVAGLLGQGDMVGGLGVGGGDTLGDAMAAAAAAAAAQGVGVGDGVGVGVGSVGGEGMSIDTTGLGGVDNHDGVDLGSAAGSAIGGGGGDLDGDNIFGGLPTLVGADFDGGFGGWGDMDLT